MFHALKNLWGRGNQLERQKEQLTKPEFGYLFATEPVNEWVSLDLEMTGLNPKKDHVLSVGAVVIRRVHQHFEIDTDSALALVCRPPVMPSHDSIVVHGLRPMDVENGLSYDAMLSRLLPMLKNRPMIGFCVDMDMAFLNTIVKPFLGVELANRLIDVSLLEQQQRQKTCRHPDYIANRKHLTALMDDYHIPRLPAHDALNDAIMTAMLFTHLYQLASTK